MSLSVTVSETRAYTITYARHVAAKVATDLKRLQRLYGQPTDVDIADYEEEVIVLLRQGYLNTVSYGFKRGDVWIEPSLHYAARELNSGSDDDPGRIRPGADIDHASFFSYLTYTDAWRNELNAAERASFKRDALPFIRAAGDEPGIEGYLYRDLTYSAGGRALERATVRSF